MKDLKINGDFKGEIKVESIHFNRIERKRVIRNNNTSGKVLTSAQWIGKEVILLFPKEKQGSKYESRNNEKI